MAPIPTVQSSAEKRNIRPLGSSQQSGSGTERRSDLVTRVKYCNTLPDLPFDTKFISYPFGSNRFVTYSTTSLERNYKYEVLTEPDLGVDVELVIPNAYNVPPNAPTPQLDPIDERLLEDDALPQKDQKRSRHHAKSVSWLRRTEYISTEQTRFQPQSIDKVEAKVGYSVKNMLKDDLGHYMDRETQITSIEKTFEDSLIPIESHFAKPGVTPVEILPVFPDFKLWKYPSAQVIFDSDPAPVGRPIPAQLEEMSQAMIRGVMDESGEQFVAYFLPTEETLEKRKRDAELEQEYADDEVYEYRMAREYNWNVKSKATKGYEENYFFVIRDDGVYYNELETRVRLNKRRVRGPNQQLNTKLCVKHIPLAASDYKFQRKRERELEPLAEEDEEEEEEEENEKEKSDDEKEAGSGDEKAKSDRSDKSSVKSDNSDSSDNEEDVNKSPKKPSSAVNKIISDDESNKSDDEIRSVKSASSNKSNKSDKSKKSGKSDNSSGSDSDSDRKSVKSGNKSSDSGSDSDEGKKSVKSDKSSGKSDSDSDSDHHDD